MAPRHPHSTSADASTQVFQRTSGSFLGYAGLAVAVFTIVLAAIDSPNLTGLRVALGIALAGVLIWAVLLRPHARIAGRTLVLRNMFSDTYVPLAAIDEVAVRQTLNVWVGDERLACAGIGRSTRRVVKGGTGRPSLFASAATNKEQPASRVTDDYPSFVETTIRTSANNARIQLRGEAPDVVRRTWAAPELVALGVLAVLLLVVLVV